MKKKLIKKSVIGYIREDWEPDAFMFQPYWNSLDMPIFFENDHIDYTRQDSNKTKLIRVRITIEELAKNSKGVISEYSVYKKQK